QNTAPLDPHDLRRQRRFPSPSLRRPPRAHLAGRQIQNACRVSLIRHLDQGAATSQLYVIRMRRDRQNIHLHFPLNSSAQTLWATQLSVGEATITHSATPPLDPLQPRSLPESRTLTLPPTPSRQPPPTESPDRANSPPPTSPSPNSTPRSAANPPQFRPPRSKPQTETQFAAHPGPALQAPFVSQTPWSSAPLYMPPRCTARPPPVPAPAMQIPQRSMPPNAPAAILAHPKATSPSLPRYCKSAGPGSQPPTATARREAVLMATHRTSPESGCPYPSARCTVQIP